MIIEKIGPHTLYYAKCEDIVELIGPQDVLCIDPPYKFSTSGGGAYRAARPMLDEIAEEELDQGFDFRIINPLLYRSAFVFCHNAQVHELSPYLAGVYLRSVQITWEKENPQPHANKNYAANVEFYFHAWNEGGHPVGTFQDKMRTIKTKKISPTLKKKYNHPTIKPADVMDKIMRNANGQTVLDCFMGSGSTGESAIKHGKVFTGVEHNKKHFDTACARIAEAVKLYGQNQKEC